MDQPVTSSKLAQAVESNLPLMYPQSKREAAVARIVVLEDVQRVNSRLAKLECTAGTWRKVIYVKHWERAKEEFDILSRIWPMFEPTAPRLAVPRPLLFIEELNACVTEEVPGKRFEKVLFASSRPIVRWFRKNRLGRDLATCGQWLARLHQFFPAHLTAAEYRERQISTLEAAATRCLEGGLRESLIEEIRQRVLSGLDRVDWSTVPGAMCLCDFSPWNVLVDNENITVMDFQRFEPGAIYEDLCFFNACIRMMPRHPLYAESFSPKIATCFLDAYRQYNPLDEECLYLFRLLKVTEWVSYHLRPPTTPYERLMKGFILGFFEHWLRQTFPADK